MVEALSHTAEENTSDNVAQSDTALQTAYLAGGCFWGIERYLSSVEGVHDTAVGYAQSQQDSPLYKTVCSGVTDAVETVRVTFDPTVVSLYTLSLLLFDCIDPFSVDRQGEDVGRQYRSGLYYTDEEQRKTYEKALKKLEFLEDKKPAVEVEELRNFYLAEDYHQHYLEQRPGAYCHIPLDKIAGVKERQKIIDSIFNLTPQQYLITQHAYTEAPFDNEYDETFEEGIYVDIVTGKPLFSSLDKYNSGCGWPAFSKPLHHELLTEHVDTSIPTRPRIEIRTAASQIHLGHVFNDGPQELGGLRYCMNSASLRFVPRVKMAEEGYGDLLYLFEEKSRD